MFKTVKIFLIILGLGVFIFPKQMFFAQSLEQSCNHKSGKKDCCKSGKKDSCHSKSSKNNSEKKNCGDDCNNCQSCTVNFVLNYLAPEFNSTLKSQFFTKILIADYCNSYYSSSLQNIWQPPKLS